MRLTEEQMDRESLEVAAENVGIPLDDLQDEAILRRSFAYKAHRLRLAWRALGQTILDELGPLGRWVRRLYGDGR